MESLDPPGAVVAHRPRDSDFDELLRAFAIPDDEMGKLGADVRERGLEAHRRRGWPCW